VKGSTYKRCKCPPRSNAQGRRLACSKKHGTWSYVVDVPLSESGRRTLGRQQITRAGFATQDLAEAELRRVIALLELPDRSDDESRLAVADLIRDHYKRYQQLPALDEVKRRLGRGLSLARPQTVGEWLDEWLEGKRKIARTTYRSYAGHIRLHLKPLLGHIPLDKLRRAHIQAAYDRIVAANEERARPVGPATIQRLHATLRKALNDAVRDGQITENPARFVELPSGKRPKPVVWTQARVLEWLATGKRPKVAVWTPEQTGAFLDYIAADRLYAYYHLLVFRGPRRGEGVGLRWTDLDLDAGVMDVAEQIVQVGWETETTTPKSDSDDVVALDALTVEVLRVHRRQQVKDQLAWGPAWAGDGHVFTTEDGRPLHPDYVSRHFVRLVRRANTLRAGDRGEAVMDVQAALGLAVDGVFGVETRRAVAEFQREHELRTANGIVDPHTWFRLLPDEPLRPYPHPGYLPPIRLHDLRHGAATLALAAGADLKVVSAMLRHKTLAITADTYTSVIPELARRAAEAAARLVPRRGSLEGADGGVSTWLAPGADNGDEDPLQEENMQVKRVRREGLEPPTRGLRVRCSAS
jgi:integrase